MVLLRLWGEESSKFIDLMGSTACWTAKQSEWLLIAARWHWFTSEVLLTGCTCRLFISANVTVADEWINKSSFPIFMSGCSEGKNPDWEQHGCFLSLYFYLARWPFQIFPFLLPKMLPILLERLYILKTRFQPMLLWFSSILLSRVCFARSFLLDSNGTFSMSAVGRG